MEQTQPATTRKTTKRKTPARLEVTPSRLVKNHLQWYGFALSEAWVMEYAKSVGLSVDQTYWSILGNVIRNLRWEVGSREINVQSVFIDDETPADATVYEADCEADSPEEPKHILIMSMCAFYKQAWPKRPTLTQVEEMTEIFGTEPRWWTDANPIAFYED